MKCGSFQAAVHQNIVSFVGNASIVVLGACRTCKLCPTMSSTCEAVQPC